MKLQKSQNRLWIVRDLSGHVQAMTLSRTSARRFRWAGDTIFSVQLTPTQLKQINTQLTKENR